MNPAPPPTPGTTCPACGVRYGWNDALAGRKLKCRCGAVVRMPRQAGGVMILEPKPGPLPTGESAAVEETAGEIPEETYDLALSEEQAKLAEPEPARLSVKHPGRCPSCGQSLKLNAILCLNCGYNFEEGRILQTAVGEEPLSPQAATTATAPPATTAPCDPAAPRASPGQPVDTKTARINSLIEKAARERRRLEEHDREAMRAYRFQEIQLPLIMLLVGIVAVTIGGIKLTGSLPMGLLAAAAMMLVEIFIMVPLTLIAVFIAAHIGEVSFGPLSTAVLKLAAICVGPGTVADLLMIPVLTILAMSMSGLFVVFAIYMIFLGLPMAKLFDLDMSEASLTVGITIVVRVIAVVFAWAIFPH